MSAHLLVIEDNDQARDNLRRLLVRAGYRVTVVADGLSGVDAARSDDTLDLVLTDVGLPDIDGNMVARILRGTTETSHLPIIAVTAHVHLGSRAASLSAGCDDWEPKPIDFSRLQDKIDRLLLREAGRDQD